MLKITGFSCDFCSCLTWFKLHVWHAGFLISLPLVETAEAMDVFSSCVVFTLGLVFTGSFIVVVVVAGFGCRVSGPSKLSGSCLSGDAG